jgi:hypothetical protein
MNIEHLYKLIIVKILYSGFFFGRIKAEPVISDLTHRIRESILNKVTYKPFYPVYVQTLIDKYFTFYHLSIFFINRDDKPHVGPVIKIPDQDLHVLFFCINRVTICDGIFASLVRDLIPYLIRRIRVDCVGTTGYQHIFIKKIWM